MSYIGKLEVNMSIRIRKVQGTLVALCAAKTKALDGDVYLDDGCHHALMVKFTEDLRTEGRLRKNASNDDIVRDLMLREEARG